MGICCKILSCVQFSNDGLLMIKIHGTLKDIITIMVIVIEILRVHVVKLVPYTGKMKTRASSILITTET